tara:strand:+ start:9841 stop:10317 length:477 start_codon:yes stop_codon:yes gene_type:complete
MSVIAIESAMEHTYAEPEDLALVQRCLDAAEDTAQDFIQRRFYADDAALAAARATVPTLRSDARAVYDAAILAAAAITDEAVKNEVIADAQAILADSLVAALRIQNGIVIKPAIVSACLLITGHLYANREDVVAGVSVAALPNGADSLLWPSRIGLGI